MEMIKYPSIEQFRNVIYHVKKTHSYVGKDDEGNPIYDGSKPLPTLTFRGTPKLHGSNGGIVLDCKTNEIQYQSRERILTLEQDNAGFMLFMKSKEERLRHIFAKIRYGECFDKFADYDNPAKAVAIFGEWCGGSIQKKVALNQLPKMFVIFGIKVLLDDDSSYWVDIIDYSLRYPDDNIYSIREFPSWELDIDFSRPEIAQNEMIKITEAVEAECPVGKYFGVSGTGEGVVWSCVSEDWKGSSTMFKVKGEKHQSSKVKTLAPIDVEAVANLHAFVDSVIAESRLEQALDNITREQMLPFEMKSMGPFLSWLVKDVMKEETDTIVENQIDPKKIGSAISNKARPWFVQKLNESVGI